MNQRHYERHSLNLTATAHHAGNTYIATVHDISIGGLQIAISDFSVPAQTQIKLDFAHFDLIDAKIIWNNRDRVGLQFVSPPEGIEEFIYNLATYGSFNQVAQNTYKFA